MLETKYAVCLSGKNEIAVFGLEILVKKIDKKKIAVVTNATDMGFDTWQPSLRKRAEELGVSVVPLENCYDSPGMVFISLEFDKIINPDRFRTDKLFNIHFSALPAYKGVYTSALPILNGERESAVTLHRIDKGIDTGEIIDQIKFPIDWSDTARDLYFKYLKFSKDLFSQWVDRLLGGDVPSIMQSGHGSTYFSKDSIDYGNITLNMNATAYQIVNQVRAFAFPEYQVPSIGSYRIGHARISERISSPRSGKILEVNHDSIRVSSIDYDVILQRDKTAELMDAASRDDLELAVECISNGADLNFRNAKGWSSLIIASYSGASGVVERLLKCGADINLASYKGTTPLMYAMSYFERTGNSDIFGLLIRSGADTHRRDIFGKSIADYALERGVSEFGRLIDRAT